MNVLITGAAGFLGHRLARALLHRSHLRDPQGAPEPIEELRLLDVVPPAQAHRPSWQSLPTRLGFDCD